MIKYILAMAITTYLIRVTPLVLFRKEIKNRFFLSFLYYVPYVCLAAMTFPAILQATSHPLAGFCGLVLALFGAYRGKSLVSVALLCCLGCGIVEIVYLFI